MNNSKKITRTDALKKMGKYSALTAMTTFTILSPLHAENTSGNIVTRPGKNDIWKD